MLDSLSGAPHAVLASVISYLPEDHFVREKRKCITIDILCNTICMLVLKI